METSNTYMHIFIKLCFFSSCFMVMKIEASSDNKVSALYVFGDSTSDPGNNNFIETPFKSDFPPYGCDLPNQVPTGRFCDGKLGTDFIASYVGLKELVPPYLDPNLGDEELITGVSFASAGSGYDPLTPTLSGVISMTGQLEYFREYKKRLEGMLGKQGTEEHVKKAVYFVSAGTNDYVVNYFTLPIRRQSFTLLSYKQFVLQHIKNFIQELLREGARKILVVGLPPMGCLPIMISLNSENALLERSCLDKFSVVARDHNMILQHELPFMQLNSSTFAPDAKISYIDVYGPIENMIQGRIQGFDEVDIGCCGSGYIETSFMCNSGSNVCSDPSKYVFWDSIHPSEKAYQNMFWANRPVIDAIVKG